MLKLNKHFALFCYKNISGNVTLYFNLVIFNLTDVLPLSIVHTRKARSRIAELKQKLGKHENI